MNEFRKGLRKGFISLACALDAADEIERLEAERDALRAELAAERENYSQHIREAVHIADALRAERDALRALLREAREYTGYAAHYGDSIEADHAGDLCTRIDAALIKGGGE